METQGDDFVNVGEFKLETASTETGLKNFVVASTIVDRGEDHSARGAVRFGSGRNSQIQTETEMSR